jgi:site-specific recombinase XerD
MTRECLPSKEREEYIAHQRRRGHSFITERQKNRYIDLFLRFCEKDARRIKAADLEKYAEHLERQSHTFATAYMKMAAPIQWCRWMANTKKIGRDPTLGMDAKAMVSRLKKKNPPASDSW